nr:PREDICTED: uncharacterized protein LOC109043471 [Bemisia tabaci]XP_018916220.1 PREDICTED: uncharacterized protein LOC109043471 [Bemisia tabaci]
MYIVRFSITCTIISTFIIADILEDTGKSVSNFPDLAKSNRFVDKTMFIKWFAEQNQSLYITAPKRFGKSTNLDMLQRFFEIPIDKDGNPINTENSDNYKLFSQVYFFNRSHLAIFRESAFFKANFGKWPVLKLNFTYIETSTFNRFLRSVALTLRRAFGSSHFLQTSKVLTNETCSFMEQVLSNHTTPQNEQEAVQFVLRSKCALEMHFNKTSLVLIDGLDSPLQAMLATHSFGRDQRAIMYCLQNLIKRIFQDNNRALCLGSLPLAGVFDFKKINMRQISFHSNPIVASFFGSTKQEAEFLLQQCSPSVNIKIAKSLFGGHEVSGEAEETNATSVNLFCTYAVRSYCRTGQVAPHSSELSFPLLDNLFKITDLTSAILDLLTGYSYDMPYRKAPKLVDYMKLEAFINKAKMSEGELPTVPRLVVDFMMQLLLDFGYFSVRNTTASAVTLTIPNLEVEQGVANCMHSWVSRFYNIEINTTEAYIKSAKALSRSTESQQNFVNSVAALFSKTAEEPCHQRSLVTPISLFLISPKSNFVVIPTIHKSSTLFISRTMLGRKTGIVITVAYDRGAKIASREIMMDEITSFLDNLRVGFTGEVDFVIGRLDFTPYVLWSALTYNNTDENAVNEYSCTIRKSKIEGNDKRPWKVLKKAWQWTRMLG